MSSTPRYLEIAEYLRGLVAQAKIGERLPSEAELCERFGVSRMTARQAVAVLANEHLLERIPGSGTFVSGPRIPRALGSPLSFSASTRQRGMVPSSRVLRAGPVKLTAEDAAALEVDLDSPAIALERLRLADGVPMAIERVVMPGADSAILDEDLTSGSLHDAFERTGRIPSRALAEVGARPATNANSELLELSSSGVVLSEIRTIYDQQGAPLEHTSTFYAAERYVFTTVLIREESLRE